MHLLIGTSGYSYPAWRSKFYPAKLPQKAMLAYYGSRFPAVEINNSFYKLPGESDLRSWASQVPKKFRFALKAPQSITHFKRLKDTAEPTAGLFHAAAALGAKRGPILFGLPPNMKKDLPRLQDFLMLLPSRAKAAFEFRHPSWFADDVFAALKKRRCALCIAHTDEFPAPPFIATANWGYVRLRRSRYTAQDLAAWLAKIQSQPWKECFVFFKHEDTATGPKFASRLQDLAAAQQ